MTINKLLSLFLLMQLLYSCSNSATDSPYPPISFIRMASLPDDGRASAVSFVINGKAYITLGRSKELAQLNDCWEYDPINNNWTKKENFPDTTRVKAVVGVVNGKAYVGLGYDNSHPNGMSYTQGLLHGMRMYDPNINKWSKPLAYFPSNAVNACISFVKGDDLFIGAGFNGETFTSEFWKYKTTEDRWIRLKDFPGDNRSNAVACSDSSHYYFGTGWNTWNKSGYSTWNHNDWWQHNIESDTWTKLKSMPDNGRTNAVALSINNRFFVATGRYYKGDLTGGKILSDILEYDNQRNVWYNRGNIPIGGRENALAFTINGKGYIGMGETSLLQNPNTILNDLWCFEP